MSKIWPSVKSIRGEGKPRRIHVPSLSEGAEIGLGELLKRTTTWLGIQPCDRCNRRARRLNGLLVFGGSKSDLTHKHITPQHGERQRPTSSMQQTRWDAGCEPDRVSVPMAGHGQRDQERWYRASVKSRTGVNSEVTLLFRKTLSRRDFLKLSGAGLAGVALLSASGGESVQAQADRCWSYHGSCTGWGTRQCIVGPKDPINSPGEELIHQCCSGWFQYPWIEVCDGRVNQGCGLCFW